MPCLDLLKGLQDQLLSASHGSSLEVLAHGQGDFSVLLVQGLHLELFLLDLLFLDGGLLVLIREVASSLGGVVRPVPGGEFSSFSLNGENDRKLWEIPDTLFIYLS